MSAYPIVPRWCWLLLWPLALVAGPASAQQPKAEWTLMFYMDADNDLERPQMQDLQEMLKVGSTDALNIIALVDRHPEGAGKYTNEAVANLPNWTTAKLLQVQENKLREIADWGEVDMGDPTVLHRFLETVTRDFPAARYAVIFGDHGMAWPGIAVDESNGNDTLTTLEMASAFEDIVKSAGKFELIGFDACVMSDIEVAKAMAPFGHYLVASEEIEPAEGWDYTALLAALRQSPGMNGAALGKVIADSYNDFFTKSTRQEMLDQARGITLGVFDLAKLAPLDRAVAALGAGSESLVARGGRDAWVRVARARAESEEYGRSGGAQKGTEVYDLVDLAENIKRGSTDPASRAAADQVIAAVHDAVVYSIHGAGRPRASGVSIFFPPDQETLTARSETSYDETTFAQNNHWYGFLSKFAAGDARDTQKPQLETVRTSAGRMVAGETAEISSLVRADDLDEASFVLARPQGDEQLIIGAVPVEPTASGGLKESWDGQWFTIRDAQTELICPITSFEELDDAQDVYWTAVPAQVRLQGTREWIDVTLNFILDFNGEELSGELIYAVEYSAHGPREIELQGGDDLRPVYFWIDASGKRTLTASDEESDVLHIDNVDDIKVGRSAVPAGNYRLGFLVRDLAGNTAEQFVAIEIP
ncbi:MAG: clostripain-related cysteine peptidase [Steroidobacteraceae bacterium]